MRTLNQIQQLTADQQKRCYFAVVSTNRVMADGTRQNNAQALVRFRDGSMHYVRDLPMIDPSNPQPNGDYSISIDNNHSDDVADQSGVGWLYLDNASRLHMMYCLSNNAAANAIKPLADDRMLQFSTEGELKDLTNGVYGDFWIMAVAPVKTGNDPGTQSVENQLKGAVMADEKENKAEDKVTKADVESMVRNMLKTNAPAKPGDVVTAVASMCDSLGITDAKWISDMVSDALSAAAGLPYKTDDDTAAPADLATGGDGVDPTANPVNAVRKNKAKMNVKTAQAGDYHPQVSQNAVVTRNDFDAKKESPEYKEIWGRALLNGWQNPHNHMPNTELAGYFKRNDITFNPGSVAFTPEYVIKHVTELLQSDGQILSHITMNNGVGQYTVPAFVTQTTYAKGRAKGATNEKVSQSATIQPRLITAQSLFKYVTLPADFVDASGGINGSAVVDWVTRELPSKVLRAAEEALIVGGVSNDETSSPTTFNAIHSIVDDVTAAGSPYGEVYTPAAGESLLNSLSTQVANVELLDSAVGNTGIYLVLSRPAYRTLLNQAVLGSGAYPANLASTPQQLADFLGIDGVIQVPWLRPSSRETGHNANIDTFMSTYQALLVNLSGVYGVGNMTPTALSQYFLRANTYDFESKLYIGAAMGAPHSAVLIKNAPAATSGTAPSGH